MRHVTLIVAAMLLAACSHATQPSAPARSTTQQPSAPPAARNTGPAQAATPAQQGQRITQASPPFDPSTFTLSLEQVAGGFTKPLYVTGAGDGSGRLFVVEQGGTIRIVQNGAVLPQPFLDVRSLITTSGEEQGLLGMAFHPHFSDNGRFFVNYTARNGDNTVAEYRASTDPNRADSGSGRVLLAIPDFAENHNAGMLAFGPDGYLYVGTGDGGGGGDPRRNGQNLQALLGKMLRLDVDHGDPYGIPPDNPFVGRGDARPEIWAYGLRNPWRYSFDRATGDLWIGDVGQNNWEEIDLQPAGSHGAENYGWSIMEGNHCFRPETGCDRTGLVTPVAEYPTHENGGCAVTGGYVYRGSAYPLLAGGYFYADYCNGRIRTLRQGAGGDWQSVELLKAGAMISSFGEDDAGELYVTGLNTGAVYRLTAAAR